MYLFSNSEVDFLSLCVYVQTQKYTESILEVNFCILCSSSEVYRKYIFNINNVFILKVISILEVAFLNLRIYFQTVKYS